MTVTPIAQIFADIKQAGRMAFMPFVTAGDPDLETSLAIVRELAERGVDLIEIGFPYSDPIADGPVIQASYTRVLKAGLHVDEIFAAFGGLKNESMPPLVAMVSYAIVFRRGPDQFVERARAAGFAGLIVPDLPGEEAGELKALTDAAGLDLIQLVAPTTSDERAASILATTSGFVYCVSVAGTTGARERLPEALSVQLERLRTLTELPLAVGFGISRPEHVAALRGKADGVIVGSAIVRMVEELSRENVDRGAGIARIGAFAAEMVEAVRG
jgi:tryptophan synthase alpha chain